MPLPTELTTPLGSAQSVVKIKGFNAQLWLGKDPGNTPLQICLIELPSAIADGKIKELWSERHGGRAAPLILGLVLDGKVTLAGPLLHGNDLPLARGLDADQAGRVLKLAKDCPDRNSAVRFLGSALETTRSETPGLENSGLFADHVLRQVMISDAENPYRREVKSAHEKAKPLLAKSGKDLIKGLGYATKANDARTDILLDADQKEIALAVLLHESERPEAASQAFNGQSPITHAMTQAEKRNLRWVITVAHDRSIRLYPAVLNVGVGRRGPCETYVQVHTGLLKESDAGLLWMLFSADALLQDKGAVYRLLADSNRFSGNLAEALRERIYVEVMPRLAKGIADARRHPRKDEAYLRDTLQMATHALFRLLFIAYAEDKDLLPFKTSQQYQRNSLKTVATDLLEDLRKTVKWGDTTTYWDKFVILSQAISKGNKSLSVPAYNGVLFSDDEEDSVHGHALSKVKLKDSVFAPALAGLLLTQPEGKDLGPVDFRSLGVREFGTIYEGLLESELSEAAEDLVLKSKDGDQIFVPATKKDEPTVREGEFYLHNKSGARKASGAYFTKEFAVDHLLDLALDKGLDDHLAKLRDLSDNDAAEALFDFKVADIAMGSGHFLIFAIDRIERKFRAYLEKRPLPAVRLQLQDLREAAQKELGDAAAQIENKLEDAALLRRLIARRCVYGVDMNPISVQLAQLAVWIHTFVPGLPLSFLEHNLIQGNSLVGVANETDFEEMLDDARLAVRDYLNEAVPTIRMMGAIADKNVSDVKEMKRLRVKALAKLEPAIAAMDIAVWSRASGETPSDHGEDLMVLLQDTRKLLQSKALYESRKGLSDLGCRHLIASFPEVFLRKTSGFDVLLGNPPWEKIHFEEPQFWVKHIPGYFAMTSAEQKAATAKACAKNSCIRGQIEDLKKASKVRAGQYGNLYGDQKNRPERYGKSSGHPDFFKLFAWRFWDLAHQNGRIGIVLPRGAFSGDAAAPWRKNLLTSSTAKDASRAELRVTTLTNKNGWVFEDVHQQYTICLCSIKKVDGHNVIGINGPFTDEEAFFADRLSFSQIPASKLLEWSAKGSLPMIPSVRMTDAFLQIRKAPNIVEKAAGSDCEWACRPIEEFNSTADKPLFDLTGVVPDKKTFPVYKGESFDIWEPDRGHNTYYGYAKSDEIILAELVKARKESHRRGGNFAFAEFPVHVINDDKTVECLFPRISFRDIARATDSRTIRAALIPPKVICTDVCPVLLFPKGCDKHVTYVLGLLCSKTLDWFARRWVEMHLTFTVFNFLPCPKVKSDHPLFELMVKTAGRLACPDKRFAGWAKSIGVEHGALKPEEKQELVDRVDATSALLYGLTETELETVFSTFHEGWDWKPDHARVLVEYRRLKTKHKL